MHPSATSLLMFAVAICFMVIYPVAVALVVHRRLAVGWRYFGYGALVFFLSQMVTRIPLVLVTTPLVAPLISRSKPLAVAWGLLLALTAGLFECGGRYLGYRWLMRREEKTWDKAIMYGLGHGGLESMLVAAPMAILQLISLLSLSSASLDAMAPSQRAVVVQQLALFASGPFWIPLLGAWERLWTLGVQVGLSVLVLQVFRRGRLVWLGLAIGLHTTVDFVAPTLIPLLGLPTVPTMLLSEATVTAFGLLCLGIVFALRPRRGRDQAVEVPVSTA